MEGQSPFMYKQDDPYGRPKIFNGWTDIVKDELVGSFVRRGIRWPRHSKILKDLIIEKQSLSGSLLGVPKLPEFGDDSSQTEVIAMIAAEAIVEAGLTKVVERFQEDIEANGLDAVYKHLVHPLQSEEEQNILNQFTEALPHGVR